MIALTSLIQADTLHAALADGQPLLIIDLCSAESYQQGHIPGAVHVAPSALSCGIKPAPGKLPAVDALKTLFQNIGLTPDMHVVVYDDAGSSWAGRMIWTLDLIGHGKASLLDGGIQAWNRAGHALSDVLPTISPSTLDIHVAPTFIAEKAHIHSRLGADDFAVWDARSAAEYRGEKVLAARGGHIPGAVHCEWTDLTDANGCVRDLAPLKEMLEARGLGLEKEVVTHCQTHRRSGLTWFVARKLLGYPDIKAYPGSWSEWGNDDDMPVES
ncbi:Thiosulfate sulfurtransferase [BD1-7 clade bacterium]|uniref:Thiosulfate sulfurtransferase n=1 Tax=BD1-7 clade bacterium TaxID=2029982 RepID=A0A5S9QAZ7_9GAMM|nr:Thiosulfate sulfurtransferase [BD1-7 clade bacterium]